MLIKSYIAIIDVQVIPFNEITQYTNMTIAEHLLYITIFTYQQKGNQELQVQLLNTIVADLQNQINNINTYGPGGGDPNEHDIGNM